jgi:hypothetical protein
MDFSPYNNVEQWFEELPSNRFPENLNYVAKYQAIKQAVAPLLSEATRGGDIEDNISLTWHDLSHIETVIKRASKLLAYSKVDLTPYGIYYLLVSIQIHDLGNIDGRKYHEARAIEILDTVYKNNDSMERNIISEIVETHSGDIDGDKDKIVYLNPATIHHEEIRTRFIAAILRFADELADEPRRASIKLLEKGKLKKGSEVHHMYAYCLTTTLINKDSKTIGLNFTIDKEAAKRQFGKFDKSLNSDIEVFLLEEIFERTLKLHMECMYCMRFLRPFIDIEKINITIEIIPQPLHKKIRPINYELVERGYPNVFSDIYKLTGEQLRANGEMWSGALLKKYIIEKLDNANNK